MVKNIGGRCKQVLFEGCITIRHGGASYEV